MARKISAVTPTIPEQITVHMGAPDEYAENVTVSFPEYIKNVASGEIYPTWPESALRANIYAQISFALNRVFLEFYRSRGYDFDITASTSIDQSFSEGRNIFENISDITDEIFDSYIKRAGVLEPLAAKFCNGTTVTCDGLSQWGSVSLAEQGYVPYDILTYYYGDNLELVTDAPIENVTESYPGTPLKAGDSGQKVSVIQIELNEISGNYPAIPKISPVDGIFGESTELAVRKFQEIFDLTVDGIVGRQTWYKLVFLYTGLNRLSELNSEGVYLSELTRTEAAVSAYTGLGRGSSGELVFLLQYMLSVLSVFYAQIQYVPQTGYFDTRTENSLKAFQSFSGLEPTGYADEVTWNYLYSAYITIARYFDEKGYRFPFLENRRHLPQSAAIGDSGEHVKKLQNMLNCESVHNSEIPVVTVTGYFGPRTRAGIRAFQRQSGLAVTGEADAVTIERLTTAQRHHENEVNTTFRQYPGYVLKQGMSDAEIQKSLSSEATPVKNLQSMLRLISDTVDEIPPLIPDGAYNSRTRSAVENIQGRAGLAVTGETDYYTWEAVYGEYILAERELSAPLAVAPLLNADNSFDLSDGGDTVYFVQVMLGGLSGHISGIKRTDVSGVYSDGDAENIRLVQEISALPQTGKLDKATWNALVMLYTDIAGRGHKRR